MNLDPRAQVSRISQKLGPVSLGFLHSRVLIESAESSIPV